MKWLFFVSLALAVNAVSAQIYSTDGGRTFNISYKDGRPANSSMPPEAIGTAFLNEEWNKGFVVFKNNTAVKDIQLKYNILDNKLYFLDSGKTMEFADPVKEFAFDYYSDGVLYTAHFCTGIPPIDDMNDNTFYELLVDGKYVLLKSFKKTITKVKQAYQPERDIIKDSRELYVYNHKTGTISHIKRDKKTISDSVESDDKTILNKIISDHNLKLRNEEDLIKLFVLVNEAKVKKLANQ